MGTVVVQNPAGTAESVNSGITTDCFAVAPASELMAVPVTNIAYANPITISAGSGAGIACLRATDSTGGATAIVQCDLSDLLSRTPTNKGLTVTGLTAFWTLTTTALTAGPSCAVFGQAFAAAAAAAGAPTTTSLGGTITSTPASTQTAIPTANQFYGTTFSLGTPVALNNPLQDVYAELSFPIGLNGVLYVARVVVFYNNTPI